MCIMRIRVRGACPHLFMLRLWMKCLSVTGEVTVQHACHVIACMMIVVRVMTVTPKKRVVVMSVGAREFHMFVGAHDVAWPYVIVSANMH